MKKNKIKNTGLEISEISFGTSGLGSMPDTYGYEEIMHLVKVKKELVEL